MKNLKIFLIPTLAFLGVILGLYLVFFGVVDVPPPPIPFPPPKSPYVTAVAGAGLIEASSLNISIGTTRNDIITAIYVKPGESVKKGTPLFKLDTRVLEAQVLEANARIDTVNAQLDRLICQPRQEEIPPKLAAMKQAKNAYYKKAAEWGFYKQIKDQKAVSLNDYSSSYFSTKEAKQYYLTKQGELDLLLAGAWEKDIEIASREVLQAKAELNTLQSEIDRSTITAPIDGTVLQINIRPGATVNQFYENDALILFGNIHPLNVRVEIDENDAWRVKKGAPATAFVRGNSAISSPMEFIMIEPYVVPKQAFTGDSKERVDTRVLQVIYKILREDLPLYPGQIMDVYIQAVTEGSEVK